MKPASESPRMGVLVQRLLALALLGWMVFDFPLLLLWSSNAVAVFVLWAILIGLLAWLMERDPQDDEGLRQAQADPSTSSGRTVGAGQSPSTNSGRTVGAGQSPSASPGRES